MVYLMVKKGNKGNREPVVLERLQMGQMHLSRVTLLEPYLEAWRHPSHVCGVIWDKIRERCQEGASLRELHRCFPDYQVWDRSFQGYLQRRKMSREWLRVWQVPFFDRYGGAEQLQILMDNVEEWQRYSQILVLGFNPDMAVWLPLLARRARGIDFYLDYEPRGMEELQEWIGEEYGLVSQWRILESREQPDAGPEPSAAGPSLQEVGDEGAAGKKAISYPGLSQYFRGTGALSGAGLYRHGGYPGDRAQSRQYVVGSGSPGRKTASVGGPASGGKICVTADSVEGHGVARGTIRSILLIAVFSGRRLTVNALESVRESRIDHAVAPQECLFREEHLLT